MRRLEILALVWVAACSNSHQGDVASDDGPLDGKPDTSYVENEPGTPYAGQPAPDSPLGPTLADAGSPADAGACIYGGVLLQWIGASGPDGPPSGLEQCEDGRIHSAEAWDCERPVSYRWECTEPYDSDCHTDSDCTDRDYGHCEAHGGGVYGCGCVYACADDLDCASGSACICDLDGSLWSKCQVATCRIDSDCGEGLLCKLSKSCDGTSLHCESAEDECLMHEDCEPGVGCFFEDAVGRWTCSGRLNPGC